MTSPKNLNTGNDRKATEYKVSNALDRDVERAQLNRVLFEINTRLQSAESTIKGLGGASTPTATQTINVLSDARFITVTYPTSGLFYLTIPDNAITNAKLRDSSATSVIGRSANSSGDPADIAASADKDVLRRSGTTLAFGSIDSTYITDFTEAAQDAVGAMVDSTIVYVDGTPLLTRGAITGDMSVPQASNTATLATVNSNVGTFGSATQVSQVTVNAKGLTTAASNVLIAIPSTQVTDFTEAAQDSIGAMIDSTLVYTDLTPLLTRAAITGDISIPQASNTSTLATVNSNVGTFGSATQVGQFTVNAKGLITASSNVSISVTSSAITDFTEAAQDAVGAMVNSTLTYTDATPLLSINLANENTWTAAIKSSLAANYGLQLTGATTDFRGILLSNTGATTVLGIEKSIGGQFITGSPGYSTALVTFDTNPILIGINNTERGRFTTTGFQGAVGATTPNTGAFTTLSASSTSSFSGNATFGANAFFTDSNRFVSTSGNNLLLGADGASGGLSFRTNGATRATLSSAGVLTNNSGAVFNEDGNDSDFRVEGDTDVNMIFVDASADKVGVGNNAPTEKLDVTGKVRSSSQTYTGTLTTTYGALNSGNLEFGDTNAGTANTFQYAYTRSANTLAGNKVQWSAVSGLSVGSGLLTLTGQGNLSIVSEASNYQSMQGGVFVGNAGVVPTGNPSGGGFMYSEGGAGKWRGSGGTITTFGPADPHCPECSTDYVHEWENDKYGYLAICMNCFANGVSSHTRKKGSWSTHNP